MHRRHPSLPRSILDYIDHQDSGNPHHHKLKNTHLSRKGTRKQEKVDRKKRRADHVATRPGRLVDGPDAKRRKTVHKQDHVERSQQTRTHGPSELSASIKSTPRLTALDKLALQSTRTAPKPASHTPRSREEADEDACIAYLEGKLGYSKGGRRNTVDDADGLGGEYMSLPCQHGRIETRTQICSILLMSSRFLSLMPVRVDTLWTTWTLAYVG
ncbi:hypothetical protein EV363DRAFT_1173362 [Boletus edulis]|nr:hypothetical protein EV363DRAFT_1173362 [Boletus edulis]